MKNNGNGNNRSGFTGLPGGFRDTDGTFYSLGEGGYWWSSSEYYTDDALARNLNYNDDKVGRDYDFPKSYGFSVRCIKD